MNSHLLPLAEERQNKTYRRARKVLGGFFASALGVAGVAMLAATPAVAADCPNEQFRTGPSAYLPECRAYEQISPSDKLDGQVANPIMKNGAYAGESGDRVLYPASGGFLDSPYIILEAPYAGTRDSHGWQNLALGWKPEYIPSGSYGSPVFNPYGVSDNARWTVTPSDVDPNTGNFVGSSFFKQNTETGAAVRITPAALNEWPPFPPQAFGSENFDQVMIESLAAFTQEVLDADFPYGQGSHVVYHWSESEGLSVVSRDENGDIVQGIIPTDYTRKSSNENRNMVSEDGRTVVFAERTSASGANLYLGRVGENGIEISASRNPDNTDSVNNYWAGSSKTLDRVFFTADAGLLPGEPQSQKGLYMYEVDTDSLTLISKDETGSAGTALVREAHGTSDDGSIYFFTSTEQLTADATDAGEKLYKWEYGEGLTYITQMAVHAYAPGQNGASFVSPNGRYFAFASSTSIPGVDTGGKLQAYIYDDQAGSITCASCKSDGPNEYPVVLDRDLTSMFMTNKTRTYLTDNGYLFFDTTDSLVTQDSNDTSDTYMWKNGKVQLVSTGQSLVRSEFIDASRDGSSVFFTTTEPLTPSDTDTVRDIYVARINGGLEREQANTTSPCSGDGCQGSASPNPDHPGTPTGDYDSNDQVTPTRPLRIAARAQRVSHRGFTPVGVRAPKAGRMVLHGPAIRNVGKAFARPGVQVVRAHLTRRAKRLLIRRGALRTKARVVFRAQGGGGAVKQVSLAFRLKGGNR